MTTILIRLFGLGTLAIGLMAVCGFMLNRNRMYHWLDTPTDVGMAFNTAVAFSLVGLALILLAEKCDSRK